MMKKSHLLFLVIFICLFAGDVYSMSINSNDFQKIHYELFQDVKKLNQYTRFNKVKLKNVDIVDLNLDGSEFTGGVFSNIKWKNVSFEKAMFTKITFDGCVFEGCSLDESRFIDCVFKNCKFTDSSVSQVSWKTGSFFSCIFENSFMNQWQGDEIVFEKGKIFDTPISQGKIKYIFKKVELDGVRIMMTEGFFPLTIEDSVLSEVDFGKSQFSDVVLRRVKQGEGGVKFNSVTAKSISFEEVDMQRGIGMGWANVGLVRIVGGKLYGPAFKDANIAKTVIRDAYVTRFAIGHMEQVEVSNTTLHRSGLFEGGIKEFSVTNSTIDEIVGKNFKADIVLWDNVTLDGKIDLTNAQVKDFRPSRIQRGPNLQLITTGSNIRFN